MEDGKSVIEMVVTKAVQRSVWEKGREKKYYQQLTWVSSFFHFSFLPNMTLTLLILSYHLILY